MEALQSKHCFSVSNGQISLFSMSTVKPEDVEKYRPQFYELLHERTQAMLEEKTKTTGNIVLGALIFVSPMKAIRH